MAKKYIPLKQSLLISLLCIILTSNQTIAAGTAEVLDHVSLRVCADPNNLPFSNNSEEGFENKIAQLLANDLGKRLSYTWFPQSQGFVRSTLNAYTCDVIIGISAAHGLVLNTNAYYKSIFTLVYHSDENPLVSTLANPSVKKMKRIGIVAGTPPTNLMLDYNLIEQLAPYHLMVDTRVISVGEQMIKHLQQEKIDAAVLWGPIGGYYAGKLSKNLTVSPLYDDDSERHRMAYSITMGVRHGEIEWKRRLNRFIREHHESINQILQEYHVPLVSKK